MNKKVKNSGGISILGVLLLAVVLILVLSYFNISLRVIVENPTTKDNFSYVGDHSRSLWDDYLKKPVTNFWDEIVIKIFWASFISNMERVRDGKPTDFDLAAPKVPGQPQAQGVK